MRLKTQKKFWGFERVKVARVVNEIKTIKVFALFLLFRWFWGVTKSERKNYLKYMSPLCVEKKGGYFGNTGQWRYGGCIFTWFIG